MIESNQKYKKKYPQYLSASKTLNLLKENDLLTDGYNLYKVIYCFKSAVPNKPPQIKLEKIENV